jgi:hypothetical protein
MVVTMRKTNPSLHVLPVSARRRRSQSGLEAIEFGLWSLLMTPAFVWMFIYGMNFIRLNKASDVTRSASMLYIKGSNLTQIDNQKIIQRVANGLDLQVETGGTVSNSLGSGLVVVSKLQWIDNSCGCTNSNQHVITQRIYVGNRSLQINGQTAESFSGNAPSGIWNSATGDVSNFTTDTRARASSAYNTVWGSSLSNGQVVYLVETFFKTVDVGVGQFDSRGIYQRVFM